MSQKRDMGHAFLWRILSELVEVRAFPPRGAERKNAPGMGHPFLYYYFRPHEYRDISKTDG